MPFKILNDVMYLGDQKHKMLDELLDNALDEALAQKSSEVRLWNLSNMVVVGDNGRGFPVGKYNGEDIPVLALTVLKSGEKFDSYTYSYRIGLHGVGLTAVTALSSSVILITQSKGGLYYEIKLTENGNTVRTSYRSYSKKLNGGSTDPELKACEDLFLNNDLSTLIAFTPMDDTGLLGDVWDSDWLSERLNALRFHNLDNLKIFLNDKEQDLRDAVTYDYKFESKITSVGIWYDVKSNNRKIKGSVNLLPVEGANIRSLEFAIMDAWEPFIKRRVIEPEDTLLGLRANSSILMKELRFQGQAKGGLVNKRSDIDPMFVKFTKDYTQWLKNNTSYRETLLNKFEDYRKYVKKSLSQKYIEKVIKYGDVSDTGYVSRRTKIVKLRDCSSTKRDDTELFLCEGDSAGNTLLSCRNSKIHAVLPLRGKVLNIVNEKIKRILENAEIRDLIESIGVGIHPNINISKKRYGKVVIMADSDPDGKHINALLLGAISHLFPELILDGSVYLCIAPLYKQGGKFIYDEKDLEPNKSFDHFKGLGEMNSDQLEKVAFSSSRVLVQITANK